jgi:hypothetical protein
MLNLVGVLFITRTVALHVKGKTHNLQAEENLCGDKDFDPLIAPVVQDQGSFWRSKGFVVYPGAVSALGALRYGGNSVFVGDRRHMLDHDADFVVVGPKNVSVDKISIRGIQNELDAYMLGKGWKFGWYDLEREGFELFTTMARIYRNNANGLQDDNGHSFLPVGQRILRPPNEMQLNFQRAQMGWGFEHLKEMSPESAGPAIDNVKKSLVPLKAALYPNVAFSRPWIQFDIFLFRGLQPNFPPHPTKKLLFHGVTMPYPADPNLFTSLLQMCFWDKKSPPGKMASNNDICAFSLPRKLFSDDMDDTSENNQVARKCSAALLAHGYESFHSCHERNP